MCNYYNFILDKHSIVDIMWLTMDFSSHLDSPSK